MPSGPSSIPIEHRILSVSGIGQWRNQGGAGRGHGPPPPTTLKKL
jgi:hypothetical protein